MGPTLEKPSSARQKSALVLGFPFAACARRRVSLLGAQLAVVSFEGKDSQVPLHFLLRLDVTYPSIRHLHGVVT